jgi:hypothetical protein
MEAVPPRSTISDHLSTTVYIVLQCLTLCGFSIDSGLGKWLASSPSIYRTVLGTVLEQFSEKQSSPLMEWLTNSPRHLWNCLGNCVLTTGQLCLTAVKCLTNSPPIYRTVLGTVLEQFSGNSPHPYGSCPPRSTISDRLSTTVYIVLQCLTLCGLSI